MNSTTATNREKAFSFLISLSLLILFAFSVSYFGEDRIRLIVDSSGLWAPLIILLLKALTIIIPPLSGVPLYLMAGSLFGVADGLMIILIGDVIGYSTAFYIGRYLGQDRIEALMSKNEAGMISKIVLRLSTIKGFIIACCIFSFASELVAYAAGLSRLPYKYFLPILMAGNSIVAFIIVWTSSKVGLSVGLVVVLLGSLALFSLISFIASKWYDKRKERRQAIR